MNLPRIHPHHPLHRLIAAHAHAHARRAAIAREYLAEARSSDTPAHLRPACLKAARRWGEDARRSYGQAKALLECGHYAGGTFTPQEPYRETAAR